MNEYSEAELSIKIERFLDRKFNERLGTPGVSRLTWYKSNNLDWRAWNILNIDSRLKSYNQ